MSTISKTGYLGGATRLRRIGEKLQAEGDKIYSDLGINFKASWFATYHTLVQTDKPLTMQEITASIDFTHITVKNIVRELEENGYVKIKPNPHDARSKHVSLTVKGKNLLTKLQPVWKSIALNLRLLLTSGHPNFIAIIGRVETEMEQRPLHRRVLQSSSPEQITVCDYRPSLKPYFTELVGPWLENLLDGKPEKEDGLALEHPDKVYIKTGGFIFFAQNEAQKVIGCVALKRLNEDSFELCKLYVHPEARKQGIATKLIERCINRCRENAARDLWLQSTNSMPEAHRLYDSLGFKDAAAPTYMLVLNRTQKIMRLHL